MDERIIKHYFCTFQVLSSFKRSHAESKEPLIQISWIINSIENFVGELVRETVNVIF